MLTVNFYWKQFFVIKVKESMVTYIRIQYITSIQKVQRKLKNACNFFEFQCLFIVIFISSGYISASYIK